MFKLKFNTIKQLLVLVSLIYLSLVALPKTVNCKQTQDIVLKPKDTNVKQGDTVILNCTVTENHGDVQWTHDGTALGYDRKVPGKPRYSVIWHENENVEYHLKIENVTTEDEGLFSCQVAPIGDWDTKREEKAKLVVLVGPEQSPEILFNDESKKPGEIVNYRSLSKTPTKYACIVRKSKPAAKISWFLNGNLVNSSVGTTKDYPTTGKLFFL
jgi:hypothetical protein